MTHVCCVWACVQTLLAAMSSDAKADAKPAAPAADAKSEEKKGTKRKRAEKKEAKPPAVGTRKSGRLAGEKGAAIQDIAPTKKADGEKKPRAPKKPKVEGEKTEKKSVRPSPAASCLIAVVVPVSRAFFPPLHAGVHFWRETRVLGGKRGAHTATADSDRLRV